MHTQYGWLSVLLRKVDEVTEQNILHNTENSFRVNGKLLYTGSSLSHFQIIFRIFTAVYCAILYIHNVLLY